MHVGFVGTGNMGGPMATNVLKAGHQLTIFDARAEATAPLEKLGARRAPDLPTVAAAVEVTLTSLPNDAIVEEVLFGSAGTPGLVAGAQAGHVVFDLSTVRPDTQRAQATAPKSQGRRGNSMARRARLASAGSTAQDCSSSSSLRRGLSLPDVRDGGTSNPAA